MPNFKLKQVVQQFEDSSRSAEQTVTIDTEDNFIIIKHDGHELPMSIDNWSKMKKLIEQCETLASIKS